MLGKRQFDTLRNAIQFNPNENPNEKLLYETVSVEYCEVQAKILINDAQEIRKKNPHNVEVWLSDYDNKLNEAIKLLLFAKAKNNGTSETKG